jgi:hypothetical protein
MVYKHVGQVYELLYLCPNVVSELVLGGYKILLIPSNFDCPPIYYPLVLIIIIILNSLVISFKDIKKLN